MQCKRSGDNIFFIRPQVNKCVNKYELRVNVECKVWSQIQMKKGLACLAYTLKKVSIYSQKSTQHLKKNYEK